MNSQYNFVRGLGFPDVLTPTDELGSSFEKAVLSEYHRLVDLAEIRDFIFLPSHGDLPNISTNAVLKSPLKEIKDSGMISIANVYYRAGITGSIPAPMARIEVVRRLSLAQKNLPENFGLVLLDGYRTIELQRALYDMNYLNASDLAEGFVNRPNDSIETPPPHTTGGAVDVSLTYKGIPLALGTHYDEFNEKTLAMAKNNISHMDYMLRKLLIHAMYDADFVVIPEEWWHFEYGTRFHAAATHKKAMFGRINLDSTLYAGSEDSDTKILPQM